jgi:hypothetical protein
MFAKLFRSIQKAWRKDRAGQIEILPPLQQSRALPDPKRPHHRRVNEVRKALDSAPPGLSFRKLIVYVRRRTGTGASPKLIGRWRRGGLVLVLVSMMGGGGNIANPIPAKAEADRPHLIKVRLTITTANDLKVKTGEMIASGAVLADRRNDRQRLERQRQSLALSIKRLDTQTATINSSIKLLDQLNAAMPSPVFAAERAAIRSAETGAEAELRKVELQRRRATEIPALLPEGNDRETVAAHETIKLLQAVDVHRQSLAQVELAKAKFESAREAREFEMKRYSVEVTRQFLDARSRLQQAEIARAQLIAQMAAIDDRLEELSTVCAPFGGKVERISWEEQHDRTITVVVYLSVADVVGAR